MKLDLLRPLRLFPVNFEKSDVMTLISSGTSLSTFPSNGYKALRFADVCGRLEFWTSIFLNRYARFQERLRSLRQSRVGYPSVHLRITITCPEVLFLMGLRTPCQSMEFYFAVFIFSSSAAFSSLRRILPTPLFGRASINSTAVGTLYFASFSWQNFITSSAVIC